MRLVLVTICLFVCLVTINKVGKVIPNYVLLMLLSTTEVGIEQEVQGHEHTLQHPS